MKLQISPERGGLLVSAKDALPPEGRDHGEHMLLAAAVLEQIYREARFVVEDEPFPPFVVTGWIARKADRNTILGFEPSKTLLQERNRLEASTGQPWELRVKTIKGLGRTSFLRPRRYQKHG